MLKKIISYLTILTISAEILYAADIPIIVIAPGKTTQSYSTVGSAVSVIDSEDLENSNEFFLGNVLDDGLPGMNYFRQGGHGTISAIQLRGLPKRYSTIYIDGVKMSDPSTSDNSFYFSNIMTSSIDRVEILRGSQSSLYGSSAIGGTINIFTKKGKKGNNQEIDISSGSNGTKNINLSYSGAKEKHNYFIGLNRFLTDGISAMNDEPASNDDDSYRNDGIVANYGYKIFENLDFETGFRFSDSFLNYDRVKAGQTDANDSSDDNEISFNARLVHDTGKLKNTIIYNKTDIERATLNYLKSPSNYFGYRDAINLIGEYKFNLDTKIFYGFDNEFDKSRLKDDWSGLYETNDESIHSQYVDVQFRPQEKLYTTIGFRRDNHTTAGDYNTGRITAAYKLNNLSKIRTSYGTGIRYPSLYDYFYGTVVSEKEILKPEKSKSFDIGYETFIEKMNMNLNVSAFRIDYDDPLEGWQSNTDDLGGWTIKNSTGKIKSEGIELSTLWKPKENFNIGFDYNYNETYDGSDCDNPDKGANECIDPAMVRVPRHNFTSSINHNMGKNLENSLLIRYRGETRDYGNTNNGFADVILDDNITFDYVGSYNLYDTYNLFFSVKNIFDQDYEQAYQYSTMDRSYNFGIRRRY